MPGSQKQTKMRANSLTKEPRLRQILGLCPAGLALAFLAHVLLFLTALLIARHEQVYIMAAVGYATLSGILGQKVWRLRRDRKRGAEHNAWTNEYEKETS